MNYYEPKKKVLITGISGTLGKAVSEILLKDGHSVTGYSRDELKQAQLENKNKMTLYLGDVRDRERLVEASRGMDIIFHFAALKRVDSLEENPEEAYKTNVIGTDNVLHAQRYNKIARIVLSSTDKACYPINTYGCTKKIAEALVLRNPKNIVCRYGNVLASRGSVIPVFVEQIMMKKPVTITNMEMTRFFLRIEDAAQFVVKSSNDYMGGLKVPMMKACKITDLAVAIGEILKQPVEFKDIGIRAGEKLHECLKMTHEGHEIHSNTAYQFTKDQLKELIEPIVRGL